MPKQILGLGALLLVMIPFFMSSERCAAKPPDLPVRIEIECVPQAEEVSPGRLFLRQLGEAQKMFHNAERCLQTGDLETARTCYHETVRLCPESEYAQRARRRLRRIVRKLEETSGIESETSFAPVSKAPKATSAENDGDKSSLPIASAIGAVLGVTHFELEIDGDRGNGNRILGSVHFGSFGCRVRLDNGCWNVRFSAARPTD